MPERKWYDSTWALVLLLLFCSPVGFVLLWRKPWKTATKVIITAAVLVVLIAGLASGSPNSRR